MRCSERLRAVTACATHRLRPPASHLSPAHRLRQPSAVAELGVVRRLRKSPVKLESFQRVFGIALLLLGVGALLFCFFGIRPLHAHVTWYLPHFFGSQRAAQVTYDDLFRYAQQLTEARGRAELRFWYLLAGSSSLLGVVLLAWSRDRRRLCSVSPRHEPTVA